MTFYVHNMLKRIILVSNLTNSHSKSIHKVKKYLFIYILLFAGFSAKSQVENTLFHMPALPQSAHYNPGKFLDYNVAITLPGLSGGNFFASNSGFSFNDVFRFESDRTVFLPEGLSDAAIKNNTFAVGARANLFGVYIRTKKMGSTSE